MTNSEAEAKYKKMGLKTVRAKDEPNKHYEKHSHHATWLYYLKGSVKIKLDDGEWQTIGPNQEVVIKEGQPHEAIVGPQGAEYIFAYPPDTAPFSYQAKG